MARLWKLCMACPKLTTSSSIHLIRLNQASKCESPKPNRKPLNLRMNEVRPKRLGFGIKIAFLCALALAGCYVGPDYKRPAPGPLPTVWKAGSPWKEGQPRDAEIKQKFWEVFDDPVLTGLELEATTNSPDVRAALERVEQSRAIARISRADLLPGLSLDPNGNRTRYSPSRTAQPGSV